MASGQGHPEHHAAKERSTSVLVSASVGGQGRIWPVLPAARLKTLRAYGCIAEPRLRRWLATMCDSMRREGQQNRATLSYLRCCSWWYEVGVKQRSTHTNRLEPRGVQPT